MATQKVRPDHDRDEQQRVQRRQVSRTIIAGTLAIAAIVGAIVVLIAVVAVGPEVRPGQPSTAGPAVVTEPSGSPAAGLGPAEPEYEMLPINPAGYVMHVRTTHRTLDLTDPAFRLGDRFIALLGSAEPTGQGLALTTEHARALAEILDRHSWRFDVTSTDAFLGRIYTGTVTHGIDVRSYPVDVRIEFRARGSERAAPEPGNHGKVVMSESETGDAMFTDAASAVYVFADGRVIWQRMSVAPDAGTGGWLLRRLNPKGISLLQPDTAADMGEDSNPKLLDPFGLPVGAWKDPTPEPYRAPRYAVCPEDFYVPTDWRQLPPGARDMLNETEEGYIRNCAVVTTADARRLDKILSSTEGFERNESHEYRIKTDSGTASIGVYPVLPSATLDRVCQDFWTDC